MDFYVFFSRKKPKTAPEIWTFFPLFQHQTIQLVFLSSYHKRKNYLKEIQSNDTSQNWLFM